jgi:outer membrane beta-barrel protein
MKLLNIKILGVLALLIFAASNASAQSAAYKRKDKAPAVTKTTDATTAVPVEGAAPAKDAPKSDSEKMDLTDLEQKYWAPKDTDFGVVQNRTYTKAKRYAFSYMLGPIVNDTFSTGLNHTFTGNYYFDERYGVELTFQTSKLKDSKSIDDFKKLSGGGTSPDYNRDKSFIGVGFNYVPFYAKMSFLGQKIIYFDMQVTPFLGVSTYEQKSTVKNPTETAFSYGYDVTQYFFFSNHVAVRANLHNRFYQADILSYSGVNAGKIRRSGESQNTTMFLMGITYFY